MPTSPPASPGSMRAIAARGPDRQVPFAQVTHFRDLTANPPDPFVRGRQPLRSDFERQWWIPEVIRTGPARTSTFRSPRKVGRSLVNPWASHLPSSLGRGSSRRRKRDLSHHETRSRDARSDARVVSTTHVTPSGHAVLAVAADISPTTWGRAARAHVHAPVTKVGKCGQLTLAAKVLGRHSDRSAARLQTILNARSELLARHLHRS